MSDESLTPDPQPPPPDKNRLGPRLGTGDEGMTDLLGPGRVPKYDLRVQTYGELDEASSALGLARALCRQHRTQEIVRRVQHDLYMMMAEIATPDLIIVMVEHVMTAVRRLCASTTVLADGQVLLSGPTEEVLHDPRTIEIYLGAQLAA